MCSAPAPQQTNNLYQYETQLAIRSYLDGLYYNMTFQAFALH